MEIENVEIEPTENQTALAQALSEAFDHMEAGGEAPDDPVLEIDEAIEPKEGENQEPVVKPVKEAGTEVDDHAEGTDFDDDGDGEDQDQPETNPYEVAPSSWKKDVAQKWADLPDDVKAEIHRRESDAHRGIKQLDELAGFGHTMQSAIAPYMQNIQSSGVAPAHAIHHLLGVEHVLRNGSQQEKAAKLAEIARDYQIDLRSVAPLPPVDPHVQQIIQQNRDLQQFQMTVQQQQQQAVKSEIEAFRANPENVYFNEVSADMAVLLQTGRAENLQEAYDKAVWMRPDIRQTLVQQQRSDAQKNAAEQKRKQRAKTAAGSVKGSANPKATKLNPDASLRDTLSAALDGNL